MIKIKNKKSLCIIISLVIMFVMSTTNICNCVNAEDKKIDNPRISENGMVTWDKITFGSYYQDASFGMEPIKWRILSIDENEDGSKRAFVVSDKILDCVKYIRNFDDDRALTWSNSNIRKWLNSDFYNMAFNETEMENISEVIVSTNDNPEYGRDSGEDTQDKIFLLSIEDLENPLYGFGGKYSEASALRRAYPTDYAVLNNAYVNISDEYNGIGSYWLRTASGFEGTLSFVDIDGKCRNMLLNELWLITGVRPAMYISLNDNMVSDAGEVSSSGIITNLEDGFNNPRINNDETVWDCVYFGNYCQKATYDKKAISWRVLSVTDNEIYAVSDKIIDCKFIDKKIRDVEWSESPIRNWLGTEFYNSAFSEEEKNVIVEKSIINKNQNNKYYETKEKVSLLSGEEVTDSLLGFDEYNNTNNVQSKTREAYISDYAAIKGTYRRMYTDIDDRGWWELRSNEFIFPAGELGANSWNFNGGIRPVIRIKYDTELWKYDGTVSVEKNSPIPTNPPIETLPTPIESLPTPINNPSIIQPTEAVPTITPSATPVPTLPEATATPEINTTTFSIKNNSKQKISAKIKIKDKDIIKIVTINGKKVKVKKGKKSITLKLKTYKKYLKKKGKVNKIVVTDKLGNKTTIKFKMK